ncbi:unnamed protein product [Parascedosporium putredinis]|uniref:1-alkyl-2-acetylglycerophosphocholine esterase n=1 Tax=Parascedosporium putredinis TaxID=1442378 RepID=A0A9P1H1X7_9PEZI|nr:unnamed protein product [Parascedosporium putredinis]CAI7993154.1 unnamed protein product [Parascedosporium putredinis]
MLFSVAGIDDMELHPSTVQQSARAPGSQFHSLEGGYSSAIQDAPLSDERRMLCSGTAWSDGQRALTSAIAREIASHGYVVVTIDHSYEGPVVELPDGTVYKAVEIDADNSTVIETVTRLRAKDYSFVLSHFIQNPVPGINLNHVFGTGHSLGGATAAVAMASDKRIIGGVNFDGLIANPALDSDALPSEAIPDLKTVFGSLLFSKAAPIMAEIVQAVVDLATHGWSRISGIYRWY